MQSCRQLRTKEAMGFFDRCHTTLNEQSGDDWIEVEFSNQFILDLFLFVGEGATIPLIIGCHYMSFL